MEEVKTGLGLEATKAKAVAVSKVITHKKTAWVRVSILVLIAFAGVNVIMTGVRLADNMTILVGGGMIVAAASAAIAMKSKLIKK
jgi:hypothetical protein